VFPLTIFLPVIACVFLSIMIIVVVLIICRRCYVKSSNIDDVTSPCAFTCCCEYDFTLRFGESRSELWFVLVLSARIGTTKVCLENLQGLLFRRGTFHTAGAFLKPSMIQQRRVTAMKQLT